MSTPPPTPRRRHIWRWVIVAIFAPWLFLGLLVWSWVTPSRAVAHLRDGLQAATAGEWHTRVQLDLGPASLAIVRTGLLFVPHKEIATARLALAAVKHASVGFYQSSDAPAHATTESLAATDRMMQRRGWVQFLRVIDDEDTVLGYAPSGENEAGQFCIAVLSDENLVVVSCKLEADELATLIHAVAGPEFRPRLAKELHSRSRK